MWILALSRESRTLRYGGVYVAAGDLESSGGLLKEAAGYMEGPAFVLVAPAETGC